MYFLTRLKVIYRASESCIFKWHSLWAQPHKYITHTAIYFVISQTKDLYLSMEDNIDIKNPFKTPHSQGFPSHQDGGALYPPPLTTHRLIVVEESHLYPQHLLSHPPISPQLQEERNLILWQRPSVLTLRLYTYMVGGGGRGGADVIYAGTHPVSPTGRDSISGGRPPGSHGWRRWDISAAFLRFYNNN